MHGVNAFDQADHHRRRTRRAEQRATMLEHQLAKALRLLGIAVQVAAGKDTDPLTLLTTLEQLDRTARHPDIDQLAQLLRDTDPQRTRRNVAA